MTSAIIRLAAASVLIELAGRRAHNLDLYTWEALGEALDDSLLGVEEVGGVKDDLALLLGSDQQIG